MSLASISTRTLERRYERLLQMRRNDPRRGEPDPRGEQYPSRALRYTWLIWALERELRRRYDLPPY